LNKDLAAQIIKARLFMLSIYSKTQTRTYIIGVEFGKIFNNFSRVQMATSDLLSHWQTVYSRAD
jgi:hypothetical protein